MPTYDYECDACGHEWELFQKITDDPKKTCPECKKKKARRLFGTGAAIVFKGSGFYETDYRSDSYKKGADKAKKSSESKEGTTDGAKSDSAKPDSPQSNVKSKSANPSSNQSKPSPDKKKD